MGNNAAFTSFESSVLAVYNRGVLDRALLDDLASPYRGMDIDRGGMTGDLAKDGSDIDEIILKVYKKKFRARPDLPKDYKTWTEKQQEANEQWYEDRHEILSKIEKGWGWR